LLIAVTIVHDVAGADHVGVGEINPGVAIGVGVVDMVQLRLAAADLDDLDAAGVGLLRYAALRGGRLCVARPAVLVAAGGETEPDVVLGDNGGAVLLEVGIAAGVVAVEVSVDDVFDRQRRDRLYGGLDLVRQRRELSVHHDDAVSADRNGDVAASS